MSGGTVGYPITGGSGSGLSIAPRLPATHLSLDRYARIIGVVSPPHFWGAYNDTIFPLQGTCDVVVPRHGWQLPLVASREEILEQIVIAEEELAGFLGYYVAPTFVKDEVHKYPKPFDPMVSSSGGLNVAAFEKSIKTRSARVLSQGIRTLTLIGTATTSGSSLTYTDEDGDGTIETVTVTMATTQTSLCEIKCYVTGTEGDPAWELRHPRSKYFDGSGNVVFQFYVWQFIDPDIDARFNTADDYRAIDYTDTSNLMSSVDIYHEDIDNTQSSARFYWESDPDCVTVGTVTDVGSLLVQDGVAIIRSAEAGLLVPRMATYDSDQSLWTADDWTVGRDPDMARVSYYAGDVSQAYLAGTTCDPLKEVYAKAIAYMATARLNKSICSCAGVVQFFENLQRDLAEAVDGSRFAVGFTDLENPFGTRQGELMAWRLIGKLGAKERAVEVAVI